ncbi:MAG: precorrin-8X methylmutase [Pseudomonadota bacterium]
MTANLYEKNPEAIYRQSFDTIVEEAALDRFSPGERDVAIRVIHACGMVDAAEQLVFSSEAVSIGRQALQNGAPILCDVEMVRSGIIRRLLPAENEVICTLDEAGVANHAKSIGNTRSAAAVDFWDAHLDGAVVVVGNAPTALFYLLEKLEHSVSKPTLILGFPVGFVGAAESKQALIENALNVPFIALRGRRGGSAIAAAALNALAAGLKSATGQDVT